MNIPSKSLQSENIDRLSADNLLRNVRMSVSEEILKLKDFIADSSEMCGKWELTGQFSRSRHREI